MGKRSLINDVTITPGFQLLMALLVVGSTGLLIRDLTAEDRSALGMVMRAATVACWLVLLMAGVIGRRRQRRKRAEVGAEVAEG